MATDRQERAVQIYVEKGGKSASAAMREAGYSEASAKNPQKLTDSKDKATARTVAFNAAFVAIGVTIPTTTVISKWLYVAAKYNAAAAKWHVLAANYEA